MGYIEETGAAQHYRDAKITQIYEGTNGIQAMDLVGRKLPLRSGGVFKDQVARMRATVEELAGAGDALEADPRPARRGRWTRSTRPPGGSSTTAWRSPLTRLAGAAPFQRMFSLVTSAWLMARSALAARALLDAGSTTSSETFLRAKIDTARFYAEQILPEANGLLAAVTAGRDQLFTIPVDAL